MYALADGAAALSVFLHA